MSTYTSFQAIFSRGHRTSHGEAKEYRKEENKLHVVDRSCGERYVEVNVVGIGMLLNRLIDVLLFEEGRPTFYILSRDYSSPPSSFPVFLLCGKDLTTRTHGPPVREYCLMRAAPRDIGMPASHCLML